MGRIQSLETRRKISESLTGRKGTPFTEDRKRKYSEIRKKLWANQEWRARQISAIIGTWQLKPKKQPPQTEEAKRRISQAVKCRFNNPGVRERLSEVSKKVHQQPEIRQKHSDATKKYLSEHPEMAEKRIRTWLASAKMKPNKCELKLLAILNELAPNQYRYTGDGSMIIAGRMPDFVNVNGSKKIVELFGQHWHSPEEESERIGYFRQFGFSTLVIWETELSNLDALKQKLISFVGSSISE